MDPRTDYMRNKSKQESKINECFALKGSDMINYRRISYDACSPKNHVGTINTFFNIRE